jgi:hypothetical protein
MIASNLADRHGDQHRDRNNIQRATTLDALEARRLAWLPFQIQERGIIGSKKLHDLGTNRRHLPEEAVAALLGRHRVSTVNS